MERHFVRDNYRRLGAARIAATLGRTVGSVKKMATQLRVTGVNHAPYRWTPERREAFGRAYRTDPAVAARQFGLTRMSANSYASRFGFQVRRPWKPWEDELLRELWPQHRDDELLARTGRTMRALRSRASKIGVKRPAIHEWTKWRFSA